VNSVKKGVSLLDHKFTIAELTLENPCVTNIMNINFDLTLFSRI